MQLGVRWRAGDPPHHSVPAALHASISQQEAVHPTANAWTLTWLEGRPRCALDDVVIVSLDATGRVSASPMPTHSVSTSHVPPTVEDDDDWLA